MLFRHLILRPLIAQPLRGLVTVLGVALGVAVMLGIHMANSASLGGFAAAITAVSGRASLEILSPPTGIDETLLPSLSWLRRWGVATPVIHTEVQITGAAGEETVTLIGIDPLRDPALRDYSLAGAAAREDGMALLKLLAEPDALLLAGDVANRLGAAKGTTIEILIGDRPQTCKVAGVIGTAGAVGTGASLAAQPLAVMDIAHAQTLLGRKGRIDRIDLRLHPDFDVAAAEQELRKKLPPSLTVQRPARRTQAVEKMLGAFHFNLTMLSGIALVVGLFLIYNTVSVSVITRRAEIGMLRTLGVARAGILGLFLAEALALAVVGAALGVPLAQALAAGAVALTSTTVDTLYVAAAASVPKLTAAYWLAGLGLSVPLALLAAAQPAFDAARTPPVAAILDAEEHPHARRSKELSLLVAALFMLGLGGWCATRPPLWDLPLFGYAAALCAIVAAALAVPATLAAVAAALRPTLGRLSIAGRLALAQIRASRRRLGISVAALSVSLALTVAIAVMVGSFRQTVLLWVAQTLGADLYIRPAGAAQGAVLRTDTIALLASHPRVAAAEAIHSVDLPYLDRLIKLNVGDFAAMMARPHLAFKSPGDPVSVIGAALARGEVLVSESFALRFGSGLGGEVTLPTPAGPQPFRVGGVFYDYSNDRGTVLIDRGVFTKTFGPFEPTHLALYLKPGGNAAAVRDDLLRDLSGKARVIIFTNSTLRGEVLRIFDSTFAITWALEVIAIFVAMAGIAATMLTLVLERKKEIRLLRQAGAEAALVRRTIVIEAGVLGLVSQALGVAVGLLLSLVLIYVINPQSFGWSIRLHLPWDFLLFSTLLTVLGAVVAGLYPAWSVTRGHYPIKFKIPQAKPN